MPNRLQLEGSQNPKPTRYAPIWTNRFPTGLWTQRNPLRDAGSTRIEEKFYGARGDALIAGSNVEVSNRLTLVRRPGLSAYNTATFPAINHFYEFRYDVGAVTVRVLADTANAVYNVTAPSTANTVFSKTPGSGPNYFQSVGNTLYTGNGLDTVKWDGNANLLGETEQNFSNTSFWGANTMTVADNSVTLGSLGAVGTALTGQGPDSYILSNPQVWTSHVGSPIPASNQFTFSVWMKVPVTPHTVNISLINSPSGTQQTHNCAVTTTLTRFSVTFTAEPGATGIYVAIGGNNTITNGVEVDVWGAQLEIGPSVTPYQPAGTAYHGTSEWGFHGPPTALKDQPGPFGNSFTRFWAPSQAYVGSSLNVAPGPYAILDGNGNIQVQFGSMTTGTGTPVWAAGALAPTVDGNGQWICYGPPLQWEPSTTYRFKNGQMGLIDSNGNLQLLKTAGTSGGTVPTWSVSFNTNTSDNTVVWTNAGPARQLATSYKYVYAYHSVYGHVSNASPATLSTGLVLGSNFTITLSGVTLADPQVDAVWIFRTTDNGAAYFFVASVPNTGSSWTYTDTMPDSQLNILLQAATALENSPPPAGLTIPTYHLGRIWGAVGNTLYYSNSVNTVGVPTESFPPSNYFTFPSTIIRLVTSTLGLLVFTTADIYLVQGNGVNSLLFAQLLLEGIGLLSYNALHVNGSTYYLLTADSQLLSLDAGAGTVELGFPIGDKLQVYDPSASYVTWHVAGSADKGLFVSNGSTEWYRLNPTSAPESGLTWSTRATPFGGSSAIQSIEVTPGIRALLVGPQSSGQILMRDHTVSTDNGTTYPANCTIGSLVLAQPGQAAELSFITTDSVAVGSRPTIAVLLDEAVPYYTGAFETLANYVNDPPYLPPSTSLYSNRYYFSQSQQPAWCRHMQIQLLWPAEAFQNELLSMTVFGAHHQEA